MRSDSLDVPSAPEQPPELRFAPEQGVYNSMISPGRSEAVEEIALDRALPDGVTLADGVDLDVLDPCDLGGPRRICAAKTKAGTRCTAPALGARVVCSVHAGKLDPAEGGRAKGRALRLVAEKAEERRVEAALGTRAVVASALAAKHEQIRDAIGHLADRAAEGDRAAALALIPWINQGLGMPATSGTVEVSTPSGDMPLDALDTASLRALLAVPSP